MANTVNDVMNVIASPDYGIKNIAGSTKEILAILQGTENSKNNIHSIVDDVKNLLQKLVDANTEKNKPIEIGEKSTKFNDKHIKNILDETKNIRKSIDILTKAIIKQGLQKNSPAVAKLTDKASQKIADAMVKNIEKQNNGGGMSALVDAFTKLKNISLKDITLGNIKLKRITKIFKEASDKLNIKKKDLDNIIKFVNAAPEMIESLRRVSWRVNRVIRSNVIQKLSDIFIGSGKEPSLLMISKTLQKNKKVFEEANKVSKNIKELISSLNKSMMKLLISSLLSKSAPSAIKSLKTVIDKILPLSRKLTTNQEIFNKAAVSAKKLNVLVGHLLLTTMSLTAIAVTGIPAMLGALLLKGVVKLIIPIAKELSRNNKGISKSISTSIILTAAIGLMTITSLMLTKIAETGISSILGSIIVFGIVNINIFTFKALNKAAKHVIVGSAVMGVMSLSLILFGISLGKIANATKGMSWKQVGMIGVITVELALCVAALGIPVISALVLLGSVTMGVMSLSLLSFAQSLKVLSDLGEVPTKILHQTLNAMKTLRNFFIKNSLSLKAIRNAKRYKKLMKPFGNALKYFVKLKELGTIPLKLIHQTLNAMNTIADFYIDNPIKKKAIKQAKRYKNMLKPFGNALKYFVKLKELGTIPLKLIHQTLNAMNTISNYYIDNPIKKKVIKQAKRYKNMLKPFGKALKYFSKLKELGTIPLKLIHQTLNAMNTIADFYIDNPIKKKVIKQAKRYKNMLKPFGKALKYFVRLKELETIPLKLIHQTLNAMNAIADFYLNKDIKLLRSIHANNSAIIINNIISSFSQSSKSLEKLKDIKNISTESIKNSAISLGYILKFFEHSTIKKSFIGKSEHLETIVGKFIVVSNNIIKSTLGFTNDNFKSVKFAVKSLKKIVKFFKKNKLNNKQIENANEIITILTNTTTSMSALSNINSSNISSIGNAITNTLDGVNKVDVSQVKAVTNMFKAFNGINKSESFIEKFTDSVNKFTETCKNLMEAMNYNTDAINNFETNDSEKSSTTTIKEKINNFIGSDSNKNSKTNGVSITNVDEIARTIAEKINGVLSVDIPDTQVQLLINGTGGNEWTISRY